MRNQPEDTLNLKCSYNLIQPDVLNPLVLICGFSLYFIYIGSSYGKKEWTLTLAEIKVYGASLLTEHVKSLCKDSVF